MSLSSPKLTISIVSWNAPEHLAKCLETIRLQQTSFEVETIVVDNASSEGNAERVRRDFPWARLIVNAENLGFGAGHNKAIEAANGEFVFVLNPDTVLHDGALETLVQFAEEHPEAAIIGPKHLSPLGDLQYSCRTFPNPVAAMFRNTPLGRFFPNNRYTRDYLMTDWDHSSPREVDWVSGAAMLIRSDWLKAHGGFDERFFMYCEDVDICKRAWESGWKVLYCPLASLTHVIGASTDRAVNKMLIAFHASMYKYYKKHLVNETPFWLRALAPLGLSLRATIFILANWRDALLRKVAPRLAQPKSPPKDANLVAESTKSRDGEKAPDQQA
ncbi:MAG: glycosyltransferase family 2 protein [Armatimonadetes bacterium]|nr:glycosyltransferase family 2 protein [Armatimonadota bacterium]